jgi:replicative DNA helicase
MAKTTKIKRAGTYDDTFGDAFQSHLLAVMLQSPTFVLAYRTALHHDYFTSEVHQRIVRALLAEVDAHKVLPSVPTLTEAVREISKGADMDPVDAEISARFAEDIRDIEAVKARVVKFGQLQAAIRATFENASDLERNRTDQLLARMQDALRVGTDLTDLGEDYFAVDRSIWYADQVGGGTLIPTGIEHLDVALEGGAARGGLYCFFAPPGLGKTTALLNVGHGGVAHGFNVFHYTFEMRLDATGRRYDARLVGELNKIRRSDPEKFREAVTDRVAAFKETAGKLLLKAYPSRTCTVSMIRAHITTMAGYGIRPDVLIVDYGDIMKPERRLGEMRHEQAGIYEDLRTLAGETNAVVWTGSQASKLAVEKDHITIKDIAEAFEKSAILDGAIGLVQTLDESIDNLCRLFLCKLRDVEDKGVILCDIDRAQCLLRSRELLDKSSARATPTAQTDALHQRVRALAAKRNKVTKVVPPRKVV